MLEVEELGGGEELAGEELDGGATGSNDVVVLGSIDEHCVKVVSLFVMRS